MGETKSATCGESHPFLCEDPAGEVPLVCGLPKGHEGEHEDRREIQARLTNGIATAEQLELDRVVRAGLCWRPASGPSAQSIDEAAKEILDEAACDVVVFGTHHVTPRDMAAMAILDPLEPDPWARMRTAARFLRGEGPLRVEGVSHG